MLVLFPISSNAQKLLEQQRKNLDNSIVFLIMFVFSFMFIRFFLFMFVFFFLFLLDIEFQILCMFVEQLGKDVYNKDVKLMETNDVQSMFVCLCLFVFFGIHSCLFFFYLIIQTTTPKFPNSLSRSII